MRSWDRCVPIWLNVVMIWPDAVSSKYLEGSLAQFCRSCLPLAVDPPSVLTRTVYMAMFCCLILLQSSLVRSSMQLTVPPESVHEAPPKKALYHRSAVFIPSVSRMRTCCVPAASAGGLSGGPDVSACHPHASPTA